MEKQKFLSYRILFLY